MSYSRKNCVNSIWILLFVRNISKHLKQLISDEFKLVLLKNIDLEFDPKNEYSHWLGVNEKLDAYEFISKVHNYNISIVIVDHYGIGLE